MSAPEGHRRVDGDLTTLSRDPHPGCRDAGDGGNPGGNTGSQGWADPNFRVNGTTDPPRVEWDAYPNASGYTVELTRPTESTGREDAGYLQMSDAGPEYTLRVKAHFDDGAETEWTDWFNTCRPPAVHTGGPSDPPNCTTTQEVQSWDPEFSVNENTTPPRIEWAAYAGATGYTVEFTAPISWSGRKDNGYAEMSNAGPYYRMRAKAHAASGDTPWTEWFQTCRPPHTATADPPTSDADCSAGPTGAAGWDPEFSVNENITPPRIEWTTYAGATGYTVEFTAPINWTGRKDNGYAEMSDAGPEYTMRAKAHADNGETSWTDWFNTCRPPYEHQGGADDPPECVQPSVPTPPEADAGSDIEGKRGEEDVALAGSGAAHADGSQELAYEWQIADASHTELASLANAGAVQPGTTTPWLEDAEQAEARFTVPRRRDVSDRSALDDGNWIDFELTVTDGDGESATDTMRLTIRGSTWQAVSVSIADASADETAGTIEFEVTVDPAPRDQVSVDYATVDGVATAGDDFEAASGTLVFGGGETRGTIAVTLLDDAIDEGSETFTVLLSNPAPAGTIRFASEADREATGTIRNTDGAQTAWLSRFGRAVATGVVDALSDRIDRRAEAQRGTGTADLSLLTSLFMSGAAGKHGAGFGGTNTMAGHGVGRSGQGNGLSGHTNTMPGYAAGMPGHQNGGGFGGRPVGGMFAGGGGALLGGGMPMGPGGQEPDTYLPAGSLFVPGGEGQRWTGWARTSIGHFSSFGGALPLHGRMQMGIFGADYEIGRRLLAGMAVSHGRGEGSLTPDGLDRAYTAHSSLTSVHPYVAFDLSEDLIVWGQAGYGRGRMALVESRVSGLNMEELGAYRTGNGLSMAAVGARGALPDAGGFQLAVRSDAFLVGTTSDAVAAGAAGNLAAGKAGVSRVRAVLEGSRELKFAAGRTLTPSVEVGVRQDGGDAETGLGIETGFGVVYAEPRVGLMLDAMVNLLVAHQDSRYREWGFTGSVRFDPGLAGRGLSLTMMPSLGSASQGAGRLWALQDMSGLAPFGTPFDLGGQFAADVGYGMAGPGDRGTGTPYAGVTRSGMGYQSMRYGWRWEVGRRFNVNVEGARQGGFSGFSAGEPLDGPPDRRGAGATHSVQLRGGVSF